jgi:hypothetical protein
MSRYTESQKRALLALPADGAWLVKPNHAISSALDSLRLYYPSFVDHEWGAHGTRGAWVRRMRLTAAGIEARAILAEMHQ